MIPSTAQAHVVVDEWVRAGVTDAVACPGSRNAPLLVALDAADRDGRLRLHVRIDERGAGFLALGLGTVSGRVVPVVVTSGTAVANLHPAVLEASRAGVGLLVVSADRPVDLVGSGANQTVDQVGLYGEAARASMVMPLAEDRPGAARTWRAVVTRALDRAGGVSGGDPGPVQLNVPLREPLLDPADSVDQAPGEPDPTLAGRPDGAAWTRTVAAPPSSALAPLALRAGVRTLVVAGYGGAAVPAGTRLPDGVPVLAEPTSPLWSDPCGGRALHAGTWVLPAALDGVRDDLRPEQVVVLGRPTLHRAVSRLLADPGVEVHAVPAVAPTGGRPRPGWTDVAGAVSAVGALPDPDDWKPDAAFARAWADADDRAAAALVGDAGRRTAGSADGAVDGPALAAATVAALPPGAHLVVGASAPIRDVALAATPRADLTVHSARGVSGIDGAVSLAVGVALAHRGPTYALLGDLTFLHDTNGLLVGPDEPRGELTVVVANDDGGGIFTTLEQGAPRYSAAFERVFGTPHGTDLAALCAAHHVPHRRAEPADLPAALAPTGRPGTRVVEVAVDRARRRTAGEDTAAAVRAAVAADGPGE
ncbi:2-succinyl-5-enolpyruvyl-6-hydroxy-3-cyclohexene-1-carboxylate synthase [Actinomycetospora sp. NBRC 106375]|uniref:2-succinyl-5-enolpyruvyl-6-hydroxy-3- cyclohexene-1-carboxylic-acid synthase n=1 Tax=Actinomycetospora sp. NBRC 106375 TaxID=3032207 RepID=UPI0024A5D19F|nr:2-succinyl-5-enolpyruvyl-6-hydroxy-3-cyclohexene-1-carboxylic-acid synthase [Actinomycetospora sp. NBRC 106375]GLZ44762.1 2-succinyl-5-enolpyruvyl-6-hydroxy-3-cyclohexene-1-carboxylate synthase [Actinomycetospora sp. NBRC 106375]